jgi:NDMA-dependent alcohol dehydrogenase
METQAAILWEPHTEWSVEDIVLDPPKAGEVVVKLAASGLCRTDEHLVTGDMAIPAELLEGTGFSQYPIVGGHEGAGEVVDVGPNVTTVAAGDHVVLGFLPSCGRCPSCATGHQNLCDLGAFVLMGQQISDFTSRHHTKDGQDLALMCLLGTFAPYTVVNEASCIKVDNDIPLDKAALVSCGVTTGWGAAIYAAEVRQGETVVVVGCGGIGINAVQAAALAGARYVIGIDPLPFKREQATLFGATHTVASVEEAVGLVGEVTWGALADKAIISTSVVDGSMIATVMSLVGKGGRCVVTALGSMTQTDVTLSLFDLTTQQKQLVGSLFGSANPRRDIPRLLRLYMEGKLKLDELVTRTYDLADVNQGYQDLRDGKNIRGQILHP